MSGAANPKPSMLLEPPATSPAEFSARLLHFINHELPKLDHRGRAWSSIASDTPLFEGGVLDSLSILHLIATIEDLCGCAVPDEMVVMKHFQSVDAITVAFCSPTDSPL
jgi:acyl carrier protein